MIFQWIRERILDNRRTQRGENRHLRPRVSLSVEQLEDRSVPAAVTAVAPTLSRSLFGDFNGDGKTDMASYAGYWSVLLNNDDGRLNPPVRWAAWRGPAVWRQFYVADFNADGKDDIAGLMKNGWWYVGLSTGTSFTSSYWGSNPGIAHAALLVGDFNGDGNDDFAGVTTTGKLRVNISDGSSFTATEWSASDLEGYWTRFVVGDFNADGKDDVAGLKAGNWRVWLSTGTDFSSQDWGSWVGTHSPNQTVVGDFNGDGKDDVAQLTAQGLLLVGYSNGASFDTSLVAAGLARSGVVLSGDVDGDGDSEVAIFASGLNFLHLNSSTVERVQTAGWLPAIYWPWITLSDFDNDNKMEVVYLSRAGDVQVLRPGVDEVPVARFGYARHLGETRPYLSSAPWLSSIPRTFVDATPTYLHKQLDFNNRANFYDYSYTFRDELRRWQSEASVRGLRSYSAFTAFLRQKLDEKFVETRDLLASYYPGLTDTKYRLLMAMNLAHGHFTFGKSAVNTLWNFFAARYGNCAHFSIMIKTLAELQGIEATHYAMRISYDTPWGKYSTGHNIVIAGGMWLDGEVNVAFDIGSWQQIRAISPLSRLSTLLNRDKVYGYYNWLNYPPIRREQMGRNLDGGALVYFYRFILGGIGNGSTVIWENKARPN